MTGPASKKIRRASEIYFMIGGVFIVALATFGTLIHVGTWTTTDIITSAGLVLLGLLLIIWSKKNYDRLK